MNADERWFQGHLIELGSAECWELLGVREVGRIAYVDDRGPMVVPVTYVVNDASLLLRVAPYCTAGPPPARRAGRAGGDDIDYFTRSGWSVVVRGRIEAVDSDELPTPEPRPTPWAEGQRTLYLRLTPDLVTGRRLLEA